MKIKYRSNYIINETPRYRQLVDSNEVFDEIPKITTEANNSIDNDNVNNISNVNNVGKPAKTPQPAFDNTANNNLDINSVENINNVDVIQNEIIKHNIEAMKLIYNKLESLDSTIDNLNVKLENLKNDVEEVREPTNGEKLINKKEVSYPYYFNLNDLWSNNWFSMKYNRNNNSGIKQLPDGSYIADFDDLPKLSNIDIQKTYYDYD